MGGGAYSWSVKTMGKSKRGKSMRRVYLSSSSSSESSSLPSASDFEAVASSLLAALFLEAVALFLALEETFAAASTCCLCFATALNTSVSSQSTRWISPISCFLNSFSSLSSSSSSGEVTWPLLAPSLFLILRGGGMAGVVFDENPSAAL